MSSFVDKLKGYSKDEQIGNRNKERVKSVPGQMPSKSSSGQGLSLQPRQPQHRPLSSSGGSGPGTQQTDHYQDLQIYAQNLEEKLQRRDQKLKDRKDTIDQITEKCGNLEEHALDLKGKLLQSENDKNRLENELRQLQEKSFQSLDDAKWMPMDEQSIANELLALQARIGSWAKEHAADSMHKLEGTSEKEDNELNAFMSAVVRFDADGGIPLEVENVRQATRLCLTAILSHEIHRSIFENPFFFLFDDADAQDEEFRTRSDDLIHLKKKQHGPRLLFNLHQDALKVDEREAQIWRSQLLRLLSPSPSQENESSEMIRHSTRRRREHACHDAATSFETSAARRLLKGMDSGTRQRCVNDLETLFQEAGRISIRLWTQRTALRVSGLSDLQKYEFKVDSPVMEAHGLHKLDDPEDRRLDGCPIRIVVHPAIFGCGTHDAEEYHKFRVWAKGVVWLDAPAPDPERLPKT